MSKSAFTLLCEARGFSRIKPDYYARCIGDGVYQTIDTSEKRYVYPFSPEYSSDRRKAKTIAIGIWSLYSEWPKMNSSIEFLTGSYYPPNLLGEEEIHFQGFGTHCRIMQESGFDFLDGITNQEKLLEARTFIDKNLVTGKWIHDFWLSAPLMVCKRWDEATYEVCRQITDWWTGFHEKYNDLRTDEQYRSYFAKEDDVQKRLETAQYLWRLLRIRDERSIEAFLSKNYKQNMQWLIEHKIPIH